MSAHRNRQCATSRSGRFTFAAGRFPDKRSRLPAPKNYLLTKHDHLSLEIEIGDYITFVRETEESERPVAPPGKFVQTQKRRNTDPLCLRVRQGASPRHRLAMGGPRFGAAHRSPVTLNGCRRLSNLEKAYSSVLTKRRSGNGSRRSLRRIATKNFSSVMAIGRSASQVKRPLTPEPRTSFFTACRTR